ncbi:hypothetical protein GCM10020001_070770 [Nonomuraea salmonea]
MTSLRISLGYELEVRGRSRDVERQAFENVVDQVVLGDRLGFEAAWFVEHHFTRGFSHSSAPPTWSWPPSRSAPSASGSGSEWCCCRSSPPSARPSASPRWTC